VKSKPKKVIFFRRLFAFQFQGFQQQKGACGKARTQQKSFSLI